MIKIQETEDRELLTEILRQLKENNGYCPCHLTREASDKCMCEEFRAILKSNTPGTYECTCGRYIATITLD